MWIKICANTNVDDAKTAAELGADAVGFVMAPSSRQIDGNALTEIIDALPESVAKVGVFTTDDPSEVEQYVVGCGLTVVQLHRSYDAKMVRHLSEECGDTLKIVQAVLYDVAASDRNAANEQFTSELRAALGDDRVWAVLIDAAKGRASGGLGVSFDWKHVGGLFHATNAKNKRVILAGGLTPENVGEAIRAFQPWGVDVASGVEASPGIKNWDRLGAFIAAAQAAGSLAANAGAGVL